MVCNITVTSTQHWTRMWMVLPGVVGQEGPHGAGRVFSWAVKGQSSRHVEKGFQETGPPALELVRTAADICGS